MESVNNYLAIPTVTIILGILVTLFVPNIWSLPPEKVRIARILIILISIPALILLLFIWLGLKSKSDTTISPTMSPSPTINSPVDIAKIGVRSNAEWERYSPYVRMFDDMEMVLVPAGCFLMGSEDLPGLDGDERPIHEQCLENPYWISRYEVTNLQYGSSGVWSDINLPRENVNWFEAKQYCDTHGFRLPTVVEWEYASRGPDSLLYPWGNEFDGNNVVYEGNSEDKTSEVGSRINGASWVGAMDLSGNVIEWTSSIFSSYPYVSNDGRENTQGNLDMREVRGGAWYNNRSVVTSVDRFSLLPTEEGSGVGFRCVRDFEE